MLFAHQNTTEKLNMSDWEMVMDSHDKSPWQKYKEQLAQANPLHLLNKSHYTDEQTAKTRYDICLECPELIQLSKQCKKCGCFMAAKTKLKMATCPLNKW